MPGRIETRMASLGDVDGMSRVLREIIAQTGRQRASDPAFVKSRYVADPAIIRCTLAVEDGGSIVGFQSLRTAEAGNPYDVPVGWGIIGTHVSPRVHRRGVGRILLASTMDAAGKAGLEKIDAYIGADNPAGLRYYEAMGFRRYREPHGIVQLMLPVGNGRSTAA